MGNVSSRLGRLNKSTQKEGKQADRPNKTKSFRKSQPPDVPLEAGLFNVYHVVYYPETINTHFLFVGRDQEGGEVHHITGSDSRRHYEVMESDRPSQVSPNFSTMTWIGTVQGDRYTRFREVCRSVPPPRKEGSVWTYTYQGNSMRSTEQWTEAVIDALFSKGILEQ